MTMTGRLYGVGTGPGDPELLTLKAVRAIGEADVLAYFAKAGRSGNGRAIGALGTGRAVGPGNRAQQQAEQQHGADDQRLHSDGGSA